MALRWIGKEDERRRGSDEEQEKRHNNRFWKRLIGQKRLFRKMVSIKTGSAGRTFRYMENI